MLTGTPTRAQDTTATQRWRILALRVDFPLEEPDEPTTSGRGRFDLRPLSAALPDYLLPYDTPPHDRAHFERHLQALARYYDLVSNGRVAIEAAVFPPQDTLAYTMPQPALRYANGRTPEEIGRLWRQLLVDAVAVADTSEDRPTFSEYDSYLIIHAGLGHETGQLNDIRSVYLTSADLDAHGGPVPVDGGTHEIQDAWILPEAVDDRGRAGLNGLLAKFFGHQLGLPGLSNFADGLPAVGAWSLMDVGANRIGFVLSGDRLEFVFGVLPPHPLAWSKARLGWIEPITVQRDTTVSIVAGDRLAAVSGGVAPAVRIPLSPTEYLLLENRQQRGRTEMELPPGVTSPFGDLQLAWIEPEQAQLSHVIQESESDSLAGQPAGVWLAAHENDAFLPGSGVLVWHVDEAVIAAAPEGFNNVRERPGLMLIEADGKRDIGNAYFDRQDLTEGTRSDPFFAGAAVDGVAGTTLLRGERPPGTASHTGLATGVEVEVLSAPGDTMAVRVRFGRSMPGWPRALAGVTRLQATDLDADGSPELFVDAADVVYVVYPQDAVGTRVISGRWLAAGDGVVFAAAGSDLSAHNQTGLTPAWTVDAGGPVELGLYSPALSGFGAAIVVAGKLGLGVFDAVSGARVFGAATPVTGLAAADLDGDGDDDLVATTEDGFARVDGMESTAIDVAQSADWLAPAAADLDGDGAADLVVATSTGQLRSVGQAAGDLSIEIGVPLIAAPTFADVDGDGILEIVVLGRDEVHVLTRRGLRAAGYPTAPPTHQEAGDLRGEPVAADLDGDGAQELFVSAASGVYGFDGAGGLLSGFPVLAPATPTTSPVLADVDNDGGIDIAVAAGDVLNLWRPAAWEGAFDAGTATGWTQAGGGADGRRTHASLTSGPADSTMAELLPGDRAYCYPNPARGDEPARVRFYLSRGARVGLTVYDAVGERVETVTSDELLAAADNEISWSVQGYASGLYLCRLTARGEGGARGEVQLRLAVSQ